MRRLRRLVPLAFAVHASACGGADPTAKPPRPAAPQTGDTTAPFQSPARWVYFPREVGNPTATLPLERSCLVTTDTGDRWLVEGTRDRPCVGRGVASASPLFETIAGIRKARAGFEFVTATGTVFTSTEPLGNFVRFARPPRPLSGAAAGNELLVGVDDLGRIQSFESGADGSGWKVAPTSSTSRFVAVGADDRDHLVAVALPERLHFSSDLGRTWRPLDVAPFGAVQVTKQPNGKMRVDGLLKSYTIDAEGKPTEVPRTTDAAGPTQVGIDASLTPIAAAVREGRADVTGDRYLEVRPSPGDEDEAPFRLVRGPLAGPLETIALEGIKVCEDARLAATGKAIAIACETPAAPESRADVTIHVSTDGGAHFQELTSLRAQSFDTLRLDVDAQGNVLVGGACRPGPKKDRTTPRDTRGKKPPINDACRAKGPVLVKRGADGKATIESGVAAIEPGGVILSPLFGPEGRLFFAGYRKKDRRDAIFVSVDGGKTYEARVLDAPAADVGHDGGGEEEGNEEISGPRPVTFSGAGVRLTVDESGSIGFHAEVQGTSSYVTLDPEGRVVTAPTREGAVMGGFGRRVLGFSYDSVDGALHTFESSDGGQSFTDVATTQALVNQVGGDASITCDVGGCLLGDAVARVGWEGQTETALALTEQPFVSPPASVRDVVACEINGKSKWVKIPHTLAFGGLPRLAETFRGRAAFSVLTYDPYDGAFYVSTASTDDDPQTITTRKVLAPQKARGTQAVFARQQIEGYVVGAVNVPLNRSAIDATQPIRGVELGWVNFFSGDLATKKLDTRMSWTPDVALPTERDRWMFDPALASIVGRGVAFVPSRGVGAALYVEQGAEPRAFDLPDWASLGVTDPAFNDAMYVDKQLFGIGFVHHAPNARSFAIGHKAKGATTFDVETQTIAAYDADVGWVSIGGTPGVSVVHVDSETGLGTASTIKLGGAKIGTPEPAPTPSDLSARPRPCKDDDRKKTARIPYPYFGSRGTIQFGMKRQAFVVSENSAERTLPDSIWLLADGVVVGGTKTEPCLAGTKASGTLRGYTALVGADGEHAWLVRAMAPSSPCGCGAGEVQCRCDPADRPKAPSVSGLEVRPMVCKAAAGQAIPPEISAMAALRLPDDIP